MLQNIIVLIIVCAVVALGIFLFRKESKTKGCNCPSNNCKDKKRK